MQEMQALRGRLVWVEDQFTAIHERIELRKQPISVQELFKKLRIKSDPNAPEEEIQRVLLISEAGTGKTTLSHKLGHDWALGEWGNIV